MATTAPIILPVQTPGLTNLQKMEMKMRQLETTVENLTRDLNKNAEATRRNGKAAATASGNIQRFGVAFRSTLGPVVALYGAVRVLNGALDTLSDRQADTRLLTNGLEKLGATSQDLAKLQKQADAFGDATLFNQEDFVAGAGLLTSFTTVAVKDYERVINVAGDLAQTNKGAVKDSLLQVAKALNAPSQNLSALSRSGIQFTEQQKEQIKTLEESGKLLEAQNLILGELERQYGGNAKAAATGFAGAVDTLGENFRDFQETLARGVLPAAEQFVGITSDVLETLSAVDPVVIQVGVNIAAAATATFLWVKAINALKATALVGWIQRVLPLIAAGKTGLVVMTTKTALLTKATIALRAAMLTLPWVAAATAVAGLAAVTVDYYAKQNRMKQLIDGSTVSTDELKDAIAKQKEEVEKAGGKLRKMTENSTSNARAVNAQKNRVRELKEELELLEGTYNVKVQLEIEAGQIAAEVERRAREAGGKAVGFDTLSSAGIQEAIARANGTFKEPGSEGDGSGSGSGKSAEDAAAKAQKEAEQRAQQLASAQQLERSAERLLGIQNATTQAEKLQLESRDKIFSIAEKYGALAEKAKSDAEVEALVRAQGLEVERERLDLEQALADLREGAVSGIEDEIALLEAKLAGKEEEYRITKAIKDLEAGGAKPDEAKALVTRRNELQKNLEAQEQLKQSIEATTGVIADNLATAFKDVITGAKSADEALQQAFANIGEAFIDMAIDIIKQQLLMIANAMIMKALGIQTPGSTTAPTTPTAPAAPVNPPVTIPGSVGAVGNQGLYVDQPTKALIGESGPEYVIPASKLDSAMKKYAGGQSGEQLTQGGMSADASGGQSAGGTQVNYTGPILNFNSEDYVPASAVDGIINAAAAKGAKAGQAQTINSLKNKRSVRGKVGI